MGRDLVNAEPGSTYCGLLEAGPTVRIMVYAGEQVSADRSAAAIAEAASLALGGSGGGNASFAQGGGRNTSKIEEALDIAKSMAVGM
jgi:alanyl-tRNA synthetase